MSRSLLFKEKQQHQFIGEKKEKVTKIGRYLVQKRPFLPKKIKQANI
jgi:hypothetical protein